MLSSNGLRQRNTESVVDDKNADPADQSKNREEVVWGKTPGGKVFRVPTTHDVITTLLNPNYPKSDFDLLNLGLLGLQLVLYFLFSRRTAQIFFLCYFAFWRTAYDAGFGWVLTKQSKKKWIVKEVQRLGWLDETRRPMVRDWIRKQLIGKMGNDYSFDDLPLEYNTWLLFRQVVDVILVNDFLSYCMFAFSCFRVPDDLSLPVHVMRWAGGVALIGFNLWVKTEAHNVVKDYGWYWGDCFFQRGNLIFDGVFEMAPHPMYSVGYAGYYGLSLISGSYAVLFVSLAAHAAQFGFLILFENPHIERFYGQRKPIAKRIPIVTKPKSVDITPNILPSTNGLATPPVLESSTPALTEYVMAKMNLDREFDDDTPNENTLGGLSRHRKTLSADSVTSSNGDITPFQTLGPNKIASRPRTNSSSSRRNNSVSQHDLLNKYFKRDAVVLRNIDLLRATDAMLVLLIAYGLGFILLPTLAPQSVLLLHFLHALAWCFVNYFGLGLLLRAQSDSKFLVRHYLKNYHYPPDDGGQTAIIEAFSNWKAIYNLSLCMCFVSCLGVAWKAYLFPSAWVVGNALLRHTLGLLLVGLHIWATVESYEVLGIFGWFFGDFFMEEFPTHLEYTGIYRYLNNPEAMGGAAFFGLALISASKLVLCLAVVRHLASWWFLSNVEYPHMRKLYGDSLRKDAGFVKVIKSVASKNAKMFESHAQKHAPELRKVAREVIGKFDRVYEEAADAVEDFMSKSRPRISEVVQETRILIQHSRERFVIPRVASDLSSFDTTKYRISIVPSSTTGISSFYLGEPITIKWQAPLQHSRKDWIGIYRVGASKSKSVTRVSSLGMWLPIHDDEWDGDIPLSLARTPSPQIDAEKGTIIFKGNTLPWLVGKYEIRYHHDGKYNVMSMDGPLEIYVVKPSEPLTFTSVRESLVHVVPFCLDSDPSLIPLSCRFPTIGDADTGLTSDDESEPLSADGDSDQSDRDPDDFSFWTEKQAKRICTAIKQIFDVEYAPEVILADANLTVLANRILISKEILSST